MKRLACVIVIASALAGCAPLVGQQPMTPMEQTTATCAQVNSALRTLAFGREVGTTDDATWADVLAARRNILPKCADPDSNTLVDIAVLPAAIRGHVTKQILLLGAPK